MKKIKKWLSLMLAIVIMVSTIMCTNTSVLAEGSGDDTTAQMTKAEDGITVTGSGYDKLTVKFDVSNLLENNHFSLKISVPDGDNNIQKSSNMGNDGTTNYKIDNANCNSDNIKSDAVLSGLGGKNFTVRIETEQNKYEKVTAMVNESTGTITYEVSSLYEGTYSGSFTYPTENSLGSVADFGVFAETYTQSGDTEVNVAVKQLTTNADWGCTVNVADGFYENYVEKLDTPDDKLHFGGGSGQATLIIGNEYKIYKSSNEFWVIGSDNVTRKMGSEEKIATIVNINDAYEIDWTKAMNGLAAYASALAQKQDNVLSVSTSGNTTTIKCKANQANYYSLTAEQFNALGNIDVCGLGETGSLVFNITSNGNINNGGKHITFDGNSISNYNSGAGRVMINYGTQSGNISVGVEEGVILAPNANITSTGGNHNGSVYAKTVTASTEIHKRRWNPGPDTASISVDITGNKTLNSKASTQEFKFELWAMTEDENGNLTVSGNTALETATNQTKGDNIGKITFSRSFTEAGTYYYKVTEKDEAEAGITYSKDIYIVKIVVSDNSEGNLTAVDPVYYKLASEEENGLTESGLANKMTANGVDFSNFSNTEKLSASVTFDGKKYLDGVEVTEKGAYRFTLKETGSNYSTVKNTVETVGNEANGTFAFSKITYNKPGDYYYIIEEVDGGELENRVYYDEAVYRIKVTVSANGTVTKDIEVVPYEGAGVDEASDVVFNNYTVKVLGASASCVTINGTKVLQDVSGKTLEMEAGQFRFGLFDAEDNQIDTATNDKSGNFTFRSLTYYGEDNKTYTYKVKEIDTNDTKNYRYDSTVYTVTVTNGKVTYQKDDKAVDAMEFTNVKKTTAAQFDPLVYKVLKNQKELQAGQFTFALYEYNPETEEVGKQLDTSSNTAEGNVVFQSITYDKAGEYDYVIKEVIPNSTGRIVYDTGSVYIHVVVAMNDDGKLEAKVTYTKDGGESVDGENAAQTFVNTYQQINLRVQKRSKDAPYDPLQGAVYALYKVQGSKSVLIGQQESDENGYMTFENIEPGTYYFKEVSAPAGHTVDEYATSAFVVKENGSISYDVSDAVSALTGGTVEGESQSVQLASASVAAIALEASDEDSATTTTEETTTLTAEGVADEVVKIEVSKVDADTHEYVAGAKMQIIKKSTNEVVAEWTTGTEAKTYERTLDNDYTLDVNTEYILREAEAPEGYDTAEDTVFIFDNYGVMKIISGDDAKLSDKYGLTVYDEQLDVQKTETIQKEKHTEKEITTTTTKTVKTGDNSPVGLLLAVVIASAGVIVVSLAVRRRKTK